MSHDENTHKGRLTAVHRLRDLVSARPQRDVLFTDGAKHVADAGGAYWLLDEIALAQRSEKAVAAEEFQVWTLTVKPDHTATLTCDDGNGHVVFTKAIEFTDFPVEEITLWFANNTIYLPSEH